MKKTLFVFIFILSFVLTNAQNFKSVNNFYISNQEIIWQKVFETSMSSEEMYSKVKDSGLFEKLEKEGNKIRAELKPINAYKINKGFFASGSSMLANNYISSFVVIESKESKYRVTVKRIVLIKTTVDSLKFMGTKTYLEDPAFNYWNTEFSNNFTGNASEILNYTFSYIFDFNAILNEENW